MTTKTTLTPNPYCSVHDEMIDINYGKQHLTVPVEKVSKMYLSRKKRNYLSFIPGARLLTFDNNYNLCIKTRDGKEMTLSVKPFEKQHFIGLISFIRNQKLVNS